MLSNVRSRLVQRIYLVGVLQFAIVAACVGFLFRQYGPPTILGDDAVRRLATTLTAASDSQESLQAAVKRAGERLHSSLAVYDGTDRLLAATGLPLPNPSELGAPGGPRVPFPFPARAPIALNGRATGSLVYAAVPPSSSPPSAWFPALIILVVVGISSWLTARSLAAPLAHLARTAQAFGAGKLGVRADMKRSDELGDVAKAFDEMAERVTKSIRAERELLANVSHELRTPLQRIRIALDLADEGDAATARESLKEIAEDLGELETIVNDVLAAARLSLTDGGMASGAVPPVRTERIELQLVLEKAVSRFRAAHPSRTLETAIGDDVSLDADPMLLRRVLDNLLENADKYTEDRAVPIVLSTKRIDDAVIVEVRDRGIGVGREDLERVFEPFFRADRSRTRATGGLGLGLALSRRIVEAHRGKLVLESEPGKGTTARIELPIGRS